ncbi:MAG: hypothetical protein AB7K68_07425 [Bacteriovoracia bacterium]
MHPRAYLLLFFFSPLAFGAEDCGWNADKSFWSCDGSFSSASVGGSSSRLGDSVESNPAALPTIPTPFGVEGMYTDRSFPAGKAKFSGSTIKAFEGIGFGIGSWSEGSFAAPDLPSHFLGSSSLEEYKQYEMNPPSSLGLRLGTSVAFPKKLFPKGIRLSVGVSGGKGRTHGDWSPQAGVLLRIFGIGLGYSESYERISTLLPKITVSTLAVGFPVGPFYLGYSRIAVSSSVARSFADVVGLRFTKAKWTLYGNMKFQRDHRGNPDTWHRFGIQRRLGTRFGVGYEYGLYRYSHSALLQLYL